MRNHLKPKLVRVIDKHGDELLHRTKETIRGDRAAIKADQDWQAVCRKDAVDLPQESGTDPGTLRLERTLIFCSGLALIVGAVVLASWLWT